MRLGVRSKRAREVSYARSAGMEAISTISIGSWPYPVRGVAIKQALSPSPSAANKLIKTKAHRIAANVPDSPDESNLSLGNLYDDALAARRAKLDELSCTIGQAMAYLAQGCYLCFTPSAASRHQK